MFEWLRFWKRSPKRPAARSRPPAAGAAPAPDAEAEKYPREFRAAIAALRHNETWVRRNAAEELGRLGPAARPALPALIAAAVDVEEPVRKSASGALEKIDPEWPASPEAAQAVPMLVKALGSRFTEVWQLASFLLGRIGKPAVPELIDALADRWQDTRQVVVARSLGRIGPAAADAVPALAHELSSEHAHVRQAAAEALGQIGPAAEPAVPALIQLLTDRLPASRQAAAVALSRAGRADPAALPPLIQLLPDRADEVREAAVEALVQFGPDAVGPLVELLQAIDPKSMEEWLRVKVQNLDWSCNVVARLEQGESVAVGRRANFEEIRREPVKALRSATWCFGHAVADHLRLETAREAAVRVLAQLGPDAAPAVGVLVEALADKSRRTRLAAVRALGQIGPPARSALTGLARALAEVDPARKAATEALARVDLNWASSPELAEAIAGLAADLRRTGDFGQGAADALVAIGPASVPALIRSLGSEDRIEREAAANTLGRLGPAARDAIPALQGTLQDQHGWVRDAAARALRAIAPDSEPPQG
jgi:HEAT repeat protein